MTRAAPRRAVFLDRDGTLIDDAGYLSDPDAITLVPGVADGLIALERLGFARIVVTNQSGIGRGLFSVATYEATADRLDTLLLAAGASLTATYYCPHAPDAACACRKPETALYREAIATFDLDPAMCWYVGDNERDLAAVLELGGRAILVRTGEGRHHVAAARVLGAEVVADVATGVGVISRYL